MKNDEKNKLDSKKIFETYAFQREEDGTCTMSYTDFKFSLLAVYDILYADKKFSKVTAQQKLVN